MQSICPTKLLCSSWKKLSPRMSSVFYDRWRSSWGRFAAAATEHRQNNDSERENERRCARGCRVLGVIGGHDCVAPAR
jgi:hypothetical protein